MNNMNLQFSNTDLGLLLFFLTMSIAGLIMYLSYRDVVRKEK